MATRKIVVQGTEYDRPATDDLTLREIEMASDMGAEIPTTPGAAMNGRWIRALIMIAKQRAGEKVNAEALLNLTMSEIEFTGGDEDVPPTTGAATNRAMRRAKSTSSASRGGQAETPA